MAKESSAARLISLCKCRSSNNDPTFSLWTHLPYLYQPLLLSLYPEEEEEEEKEKVMAQIPVR